VLALGLALKIRGVLYSDCAISDVNCRSPSSKPPSMSKCIFLRQRPPSVNDHTRCGGPESTRQRSVLDAVEQCRHGRGLYSMLRARVDAVNM
jgi:hypothetical protein